MHFYEKLIISSIIFIGVVIGTAGIIGNYIKVANNEQPKDNNRIIIDFN